VTIEELAAAANQALAGAEQPSGRVNDAPDVRTIRYYTALGLVDPPHEVIAKRARYRERHLLQLVAIKRLQHSGLALAEIQRQLADAGEARLRSIARIGEPLDAPRPPQRERFWTRKPRAIAPVHAAKVAAGITVLFEHTPRAVTEQDLAALRAWLAERGLIDEEPA